MAISANAWWENRPTVGSDTAGGAFDPSIATGVTDYAATAANTASPVLTSASYNFAAGDVGAYPFIKSGTNWTPCWAKCTSVASNAATLDASIGNVVLYQGASFLNTVAGIATVASPTSGTGSVDYSQQNSVQLALTGESTATTTFTTLAAAWTPVMVGNAIYASGTGVTTGRYFMTARTSSTVCTVDRSAGTTGTSVTMNLGGALATDSEFESARGGVAGNTCWFKATGSITRTVTTNLGFSGSGSAGPVTWWGYDVVRSDDTGNRPIFTSATSSIDLVTVNSANVRNFVNLKFTHTAATRGNGISTTGSVAHLYGFVNCVFDGCKSAIFAGNASENEIIGAGIHRCQVINSTSDGLRITTDGWEVLNCYINNNTGNGVYIGTAGTRYMPTTLTGNIIANNGSSGVIHNTTTMDAVVTLNANDIYKNTSDGITVNTTTGATIIFTLENNILYGNGGYGCNLAGTTGYITVVNRSNAYGSNTSGARNNLLKGANDVTLTGDPFTTPGGTVTQIADAWANFKLNNTAGAGAACQGAGYP